MAALTGNTISERVNEWTSRTVAGDDGDDVGVAVGEGKEVHGRAVGVLVDQPIML
jgi:hypothetical protein